MGDKALGGLADETPQASYSIIAYETSKLPENYRNFILSKWKRTLRHGNDYFKLIDSDAYYKSYGQYIESLLARPGFIRLAVLSDDHDVALGFSLIQNGVLHYVYVQSEYRNKGISKYLIPVSIHTITHLTKAGIALWNHSYKHAKFNPFI